MPRPAGDLYDWREFDVDLVDEVGNRKFNPPSLRGMGRRRGFFHDKRAKTLGAVFTDHQHQLDRDLEAQELKDLVRFRRFSFCSF